MQSWTSDRVLALAPDAASASAGQSLASKKKWAALARSERAIWGHCQGSGKDPYQARIDLSEPAFKCTCPSRKFPCKHGLALLLLYANEASAFEAQPEPAWVADWFAGRQERAEKKVEKAKAAAEKPVDAEAQARRAEQRLARVQDGVAGCRVWVEDLIRRGLAAAQVESGAFWERTAARMVDAQAPGLAGLIRRVPEVIASGAGWEVRALELLGRLHLFLCAAERLDQLPEDVAGDVRTALGYTQTKEEALAGMGVPDRWVAVGQVIEEEDRLRVRRTWLVGRNTARRALVLDFAAGLQPLDPSMIVGVEFDGELAYYPSRFPLRALVKVRGEAQPLKSPLGAAADATIETGLRRYAEALGANPWTVRWPIVLSGARPARAGDAWHIVDREGRSLPLRPSAVAGLHLWRLVSASGGSEMTVAMEWDGEAALPLGVFDAESPGFHDLAPRWAA